MILLFYLLISVMTLSRHRFWANDTGPFTPVKYLGFACLLLALGHAVTKRSVPPVLRSMPARLYLALVAIAMLSWWIKGGLSGPVTATELGFSPFTSYVSFLMLLVITWSLVDTCSRLRWTLLASIASAAIGSAYVLREWQIYSRLVGPNFRPGSVVGDPNFFSVVAVASIPLCFYFAGKSYPWWQRAFCIGSMLLSAGAIAVAASRGGILALGASSLIVTLRSHHRVRNMILVGAVVLPAIAFSPAWDRLTNPSRSDEESTQIRLTFWRAGLRMLKDYPLFGIGLGNFKPMVKQYEHLSDLQIQGIAHNSYIEIAAELGAPAFVIFLGMIGGTFYGLQQVRRRAMALKNMVLVHSASGLQAGLAGGLVAAFFVSGQYQKLLWLLLFVGMRMPSLIPRTARGPVACRKGSPRQFPGATQVLQHRPARDLLTR